MVFLSLNRMKNASVGFSLYIRALKRENYSSEGGLIQKIKQCIFINLENIEIRM